MALVCFFKEDRWDHANNRITDELSVTERFTSWLDVFCLNRLHHLRTLSAFIAFSAALHPQRLYGLLGTGNPGQPSRRSHSTWALSTTIRHLFKSEVASCATREPLWPSGKALGWYWSGGTLVRIRFGSPFSSKVVVCGHCLVTLSSTIMKH